MSGFGPFCVTGTDTDVGKTVVSAALTLGLEAFYWKPIQAGLTPTTDTASVREWTGLPGTRFIPEAYRLEEPMSPHAAAELEGVEIEMDRILATELPTGAPTVVEGAGGLMVPINARGDMMIDLVGAYAPVVLVARTSLGTLNHTLLSISELKRRSISIYGVVLNGEKHVSNRRAIEKYGEVPVLGRIPPLPSIDAVSLRKAFDDLDIEPHRRR
jgi:dethiobiotin synthetase